MKRDSLPRLDLGQLQFEPLSQRPSKVTLDHLGKPLQAAADLETWLDSLPDVLAARGIKRLRDLVVQAHERGRSVAAAIGGHVVKTGCAPYLIDLLRRGVLDAVAMNGSAAIHDLELAVAGHTSEDVGPRLVAGTFGFARETSSLFAEACDRAAELEIGLGQALGELILQRDGPGTSRSLLATAASLGVPATVHVAVGTDIVHMTPALDGKSLGQATLADFRTLTAVVSTLDGGVWLNIGSAVVMPEVFLKAVSIVRNLGLSLDGLTTANLDFEQKYRGLLNVLQRPGAEGIALTGHHELMIPLLHAAIVSKLAALSPSPTPPARHRKQGSSNHADRGVLPQPGR